MLESWEKKMEGGKKRENKLKSMISSSSGAADSELLVQSTG